MKATVNELWDTGREIIAYDHSDIERPTSIRDLKECENVIVGTKICKGGPTEVMIDEQIYMVSHVKLQHPSGGGTMDVLEVY